MQDTHTIDERLAIVVGQLNAVHAQIVALVAEADATDAWAVSGIKSLPHWLTWQAGVSPATARQWVDTAAQLESHPATADLFTHGVLTLDQTAVAVQAPEHNDHEFAALAPLATVSQLRVMVRAASEPREPEPAGDQESCSHTFDENGRLHLRADLDPDRGQLVERALAEARDRLFQQGQQDLTWADALVQVCRSSLDGQAAHRRDRYRINLFLALDEPIPARWEGGLTVPDSLRRHVTCDGTLSPVFTRGGVPVSVGRTTRVIPERTRRLVMHRDRGCRFPGCGSRLGLECHHVDHWEDLGPSDTDNLIVLCGRHHRLHHQGEFTISGNPDDPPTIAFRYRHGWVIERPTPTPDSAQPVDDFTPYVHPIGEPLRSTELQFRPLE